MGPVAQRTSDDQRRMGDIRLDLEWESSRCGFGCDCSMILSATDSLLFIVYCTRQQPTWAWNTIAVTLCVVLRGTEASY